MGAESFSRLYASSRLSADTLMDYDPKLINYNGEYYDRKLAQQDNFFSTKAHGDIDVLEHYYDLPFYQITTTDTPGDFSDLGTGETSRFGLKTYASIAAIGLVLYKFGWKGIKKIPRSFGFDGGPGRPDDGDDGPDGNHHRPKGDPFKAKDPMSAEITAIEKAIAAAADLAAIVKVKTRIEKFFRNYPEESAANKALIRLLNAREECLRREYEETVQLGQRIDAARRHEAEERETTRQIILGHITARAAELVEAVEGSVTIDRGVALLAVVRDQENVTRLGGGEEIMLRTGESLAVSLRWLEKQLRQPE